MKYLLPLILIVSTLISCRKNYNCECTSSSGNAYVTNTSTIKDTKKKAEKACEKGNGTNGYATITCVIKK